MVNEDGTGDDAPSERPLVVVLAVCCAVPMVVLLLLSSALGLAFGTSVAITLGLIAALVCVAVMVRRHVTGGGHHHGR